ncbi:hypothetical protein ABK040_003415 [Willaertia magna]
MSSFSNKLVKLMTQVRQFYNNNINFYKGANKLFVGQDKNGNRYYVEQHGKIQKRMIEYNDEKVQLENIGTLNLPQSLPPEWLAWLKYMRDNPPTESESKALQEFREKLKANGEKWDAEQKRLLMQESAENTFNKATNKSSSGSNDKAPTFSYIAEKLDKEGKMSQELEELKDEIEKVNEDNEEKQRNSNINRLLSQDGKLNKQITTKNNLSNNDEENTNDPYAHLIPNPKFKRIRSAEDVERIMQEQKEAFDLPEDITDPTKLTTEEIKNLTKLYSSSRTSPFLGKAPKIRENSGLVDKQQQN